MKKNLFSITLLTILALVLCFTFVACNPTNDDPVTPPAQDGDGDTTTWQPPEGEYTIPKEEGHNQLTFYWSHPGVIEDCDIWMWWDGKEGSGYEMHPCDYGAKVVVNVPDTVTEVGFIVRTGCSDPVAHPGDKQQRMQQVKTDLQSLKGKKPTFGSRVATPIHTIAMMEEKP